HDVGARGPQAKHRLGAPPRSWRVRCRCDAASHARRWRSASREAARELLSDRQSTTATAWISITQPGRAKSSRTRALSANRCLRGAPRAACPAWRSMIQSSRAPRSKLTFAELTASTSTKRTTKEAATMKPIHVPAIAIAACAASQPLVAHAHHAMGGALPGNVFEGLVSGLAHPVIGLDHFLFVLTLGIVCFHFGRRVLGIGAFLVAALAGTILHVYQ